MFFHRDRGWTRRGTSLLWDADALARVAQPDEVVSMREFFRMALDWPDDLPSNGGDAVVVAGLEGCLDALSPDDAEDWLSVEFKTVVLSFQSNYEGQAALVFWLPSGRRRIDMAPASERYFWRGGAGRGGRVLAIGTRLFGGAESDVARILVSGEADPDFDGPAWVGLYHPRIS